LLAAGLASVALGESFGAFSLLPLPSEEEEEEEELEELEESADEDFELSEDESPEELFSAAAAAVSRLRLRVP